RFGAFFGANAPLPLEAEARIRDRFPSARGCFERFTFFWFALDFRLVGEYLVFVFGAGAAEVAAPRGRPVYAHLVAAFTTAVFWVAGRSFVHEGPASRDKFSIGPAVEGVFAIDFLDSSRRPHIATVPREAFGAGGVVGLECTFVE